MKLCLPLVALAFAVPSTAQNSAVHLQVGVDAHFDVPYDSALLPPTGLTVEAWVTYDDSTVPTGVYYWPTIARQNVAPGQESWLFRVGAAASNNKSLEFAVRGTNGTTRRIAYTFQAGQFATWTHLAATYDGTTMAILVNGAIVQSSTGTPAEIANNGGVLRVGNGDVSSPGRETWNGDLDEVRIWPFARTPAEIQSTMNMDLQAVPGQVLTFNLNGTYLDSSKQLAGAPTGPIAFVPSTLPLTPRFAGAINSGAASSVCRSMECTIAAIAEVPNPAFSIVGTKGPANSSGTILLGPRLTASPLTILGIQIHLALAWTGVSLPTNPLGNVRAAFGIPNDPALVGATLAAQWIYLDAACGAQGLTASEGLAIIVQ